MTRKLPHPRRPGRPKRAPNVSRLPVVARKRLDTYPPRVQRLLRAIAAAESQQLDPQPETA
jgi:hypothetical protein